MTVIVFGLVLGVGCGKAEQAGAESAKNEARELAAKAEQHDLIASKINPPVAHHAKLNCARVIDAAKFTGALQETAPISVEDSKTEPDAAASCSLIRGGRRVSEREQQAELKRRGRLGVLPGDELCNITTFCWTIEDPERFAAKCVDRKEKLANTLGFQTCIRVVATGVYDVNRYQFFDADTKCIFQVRGGPSMVNNDYIEKCAKAAYDLIGPEEIKVR